MSTVLVFTHAGQLIRNPFLSPDGSQPVDPATYYGFQVAHTGGGCEALVLEVGDSRIMMLTDSSGAYTPDLNDWESSLVGLKDADGDELAIAVARDMPKV